MGTADNLTEPAALQIRQLLAQASCARLDAELLLAQVLGLPRSGLFAHSERTVTAQAAAHYRELLARRTEGEPLAYLLGEREFWSLPLAVTPMVLIPRPETELVVERALALLPDSADPRRVADLGTGSGAIALALSRSRPRWQLLASDISSAALQVARANARSLGLDAIEFIAGDWFAPLAQRRFHAIVSNPPYVASGDPALHALRYEPAGALSPGATGLEALRHLIAGAPPHLEPGAWLVLEHGAQQARDVAQALVAAGYARVRCHRDLAGHERVTEAQWRQA